jgi:hypothetical protein
VPTAFWTTPQIGEVAGTSDPELYRYGVHGREFTAYFTVAPARSYHVRLKFCQTHAATKPGGYATNIYVLGKPVARDLDIAATAGGIGRALDLGVDGVRPKNGVIAIHFWNSHGGEAMVQAIEIGPSKSARAQTRPARKKSAVSPRRVAGGTAGSPNRRGRRVRREASQSESPPRPLRPLP